MDNIVKKTLEIDDEIIENDNDFLDKCIDDYRKISDMLKAYGTGEEQITFSKNIEKFNENCLVFLNYIKQCTQSDNICTLYMLRQENIIQYGKYDHGIKTDNHIIEMVSNDDLKNIYELLQNEFTSDFVEGWKHSFGKGWSLSPTIRENVKIIINSNNPSDSNWFYEESHKEHNNESPRK